MKRTVRPFQSLGAIVLLATLGGCELLKHVRIQADDRNPNALVDGKIDTAIGPRNAPDLTLRLAPPATDS